MNDFESFASIWRIDVGGHSLTVQPVPQAWAHLGGRALCARILLDEVPPACHPLGPHNKLIFSPGLLVGHLLTSCDRISIGGKSPLTGGIKESNAGGTTGLTLARLGIKALIIEGSSSSAAWQILVIDKDGARFEPARELAGKGVYESTQILRQRFGDKAAISLIGPGGEMRLSSAGIANLDKDGVPSRLAGRGGLGAVMAAKKLKAIVFDASQAPKPPIAHPEQYRAAQKALTKAVQEHPQSEVYRDYGTAAMPRMANSFSALPTRAFSTGQFEKVEQISGETLRQVTLARGGEGKPSHACMPGCVIQCSNIYPDPQGKTIVAPLEYETIGLLGSNLGIGSLDDIACMNWQLNDLGLDSIDIGAALGVAARAGFLQFGDAAQAKALIDEIRRGTPLGTILGHGAAVTGRVFGVLQVPAVKGQAMSAYEPRAIKGTGITFATSPQGADHTCGLTIRAKVDHLNPHGQGALSRQLQINMAGYDTLGACIFSGFGFSTVPDVISKLLNARYDWQTDEGILQQLGRETLTLEREFNRRAGFGAVDDRLPEWMTEEPLASNQAIFDVPESELDDVFNW